MQATDMKYLDEHLLCIHDKSFKAVMNTLTNMNRWPLQQYEYHNVSYVNCIKTLR